MKKMVQTVILTIIVVIFNQLKADAQDDTKVYDFATVKNLPTYPGGMKKFYDFLNQQIVYPQKAIAAKVQGNVFLSFIVEKDGSLSDIKVDHKLGAGTDEEAIRVIKLGKKWNPGHVNGKLIRVKYNLPVRFKLDNSTTGSVTPNTTERNAANDHDTMIYNFVSMATPPTYPGGLSSFYQFLGKNLKYPKMAIDHKVEGSVYVSFIVEKDGSLTDIKVDKKLGSGTDEEAIRVIKLAKAWNPGKENGKVVSVKYNLPVKFKLTK